MMMPKCRLFCFVLLALPLFSMSQENSPYSRYGIGNLVPSGNIVNRAMGGISAGYSDPGNNITPANINFINPCPFILNYEKAPIWALLY